MTDEQIDLVQESFAKVAPIADQAADLFYDRLFETAPEVRELFPTEMGEQKKKLMQMIGVAVQNLRNADVLVPAVQALGERHVDYNVKDEHYDSVGGALLWTLEQGLGDGYTPEVAEAWTTVYTVLADTMKAAARARVEVADSN